MEMVVHLADDIFDVVKTGTKTVEVRINDEKRRQLHIGDKLVFLKKSNEEEKIETKVEDLKYYLNFKEMIKDYTIEEVYLPGYSKEYFIKLLERFYTEEEQEKYGVVAIRFKKM